MDAAVTLPAFPIPRIGNPFDPPAEYERFRQEAVDRVKMWDGRDAWLVTRRDDIKEVLSSPHFSVNPQKPGYPFLTPSRAAFVKHHQTFIMMDPPDHTRFRRMLTRDFTQKRMEELRPGYKARRRDDRRNDPAGPPPILSKRSHSSCRSRSSRCSARPTTITSSSSNGATTD
jgi:cytochrome P450